MNELTTYLLILILINQIAILYFIIKRGGKKSSIGIGLVNSIGGKITKDACEKLGGSVKNGRCIIKTVEEDRECIVDIGRIYEENRI